MCHPIQTDSIPMCDSVEIDDECFHLLAMTYECGRETSSRFIPCGVSAHRGEVVYRVALALTDMNTDIDDILWESDLLSDYRRQQLLADFLDDPESFLLDRA